MCQPLGQKNLLFHELLVGTYSLTQQDGRWTLCDKRDNNLQISFSEILKNK